MFPEGPSKRILKRDPCPNHEVDDPEILLQSVAHELDTNVNEESQL